MADTHHDEGSPGPSRLPPELRCMIWDASLPDDDPGAVYLFTGRWFVWCGWDVAQDIYPEEQTVDGLTVTKDRLIEVSCPTQLLHVSRESRRTVLQWAKRREYMLYFRKETAGHVFVRRFASNKDTLFLPHSGLEWLRQMAASMIVPTNPRYQGWNANWQQRFVSIWLRNLFSGAKHMALPATTVCNEMQELIPLLLSQRQGLETLSAVMGEWPQALPCENRPRRIWTPGSEEPTTESMVQPRWELEIEHGPIVQMTGETSLGGMFWGEGPTIVEEGDVAEFMARAKKALHASSVEPRSPSDGWIARMRQQARGSELLCQRMVWKSASPLPLTRSEESVRS